MKKKCLAALLIDRRRADWAKKFLSSSGCAADYAVRQRVDKRPFTPFRGSLSIKCSFWPDSLPLRGCVRLRLRKGGRHRINLKSLQTESDVGHDFVVLFANAGDPVRRKRSDGRIFQLREAFADMISAESPAVHEAERVVSAADASRRTEERFFNANRAEALDSMPGAVHQ